MLSLGKSSKPDGLMDGMHCDVENSMVLMTSIIALSDIRDTSERHLPILTWYGALFALTGQCTSIN